MNRTGEVVWNRVAPQGNLDEIDVYWQQFGSEGRVTIICWDSAWTAYFNALGGRTIQEFFFDVDTSYLATKLVILKHSKNHEKYLSEIIDTIKRDLNTPKSV